MTLNPQNRVLVNFLAISGCNTHFKSEVAGDTEKRIGKIWDLFTAESYFKKTDDEDGIRTHAGRPQWISSPSP